MIKLSKDIVLEGKEITGEGYHSSDKGATFRYKVYYDTNRYQLLIGQSPKP